MQAVRKYSRMQKKGQVTIPVEFRERLGIKEGDLIAFVETDQGILISPQEIIASQALDKIGAVLKEQGLSLEQLIESGRSERTAIIKELYGIDESDQ